MQFVVAHVVVMCVCACVIAIAGTAGVAGTESCRQAEASAPDITALSLCKL